MSASRVDEELSLISLLLIPKVILSHLISLCSISQNLYRFVHAIGTYFFSLQQILSAQYYFIM
jgi:hypothetical protein